MASSWTERGPERRAMPTAVRAMKPSRASGSCAERPENRRSCFEARLAIRFPHDHAAVGLGRDRWLDRSPPPRRGRSVPPRPGPWLHPRRGAPPLDLLVPVRDRRVGLALEEVPRRPGPWVTAFAHFLGLFAVATIAVFG